jgi:uncharacterized protein (DUF697 family)/GTP-binding protein EngB required for normal cell division
LDLLMADDGNFNLSDLKWSEIAGMINSEMKRIGAEMDRFNGLVFGSSGVGKSTLLNAIFGKEVAAVGKGEPVTKDFNKIEVQGKPFSIYDSKGFEIADSTTVENVRKFILEMRQSTDGKSQIHFAWLCILEAANRVESVHKSFVEMLADLHIPTIVVLMQSKGDEEFQGKVADECSRASAIIPVMAEKSSSKLYTIEVFGLAELVAKTSELMPESVRSAFEYAQVADWQRKIDRAREAINWAALAAAGSAPIPIPFGHSAALVGIQAIMMAKINHSLGVEIDAADGKHIAVGMFGVIAATQGGKLLFAEGIKFLPFFGSAAGTVVGGVVGVTITKVFGEIYLSVVSEIMKKGDVFPESDALIEMLKQAFFIKKDELMTMFK